MDTSLHRLRRPERRQLGLLRHAAKRIRHPAPRLHARSSRLPPSILLKRVMRTIRECAKGVSVGQICKVFVKYMDQHPEKENEPAGLGLMDALFDAKLARYAEMSTSGYTLEPKP